MENAEIEQRMRPGAWSDQGFLAPGWSLDRVLGEDQQTLQSLGVDSGPIADRLQELLTAARDSDWARPVRAGDHTVEIVRFRGFITCPWAPEQFGACPHGYGGRPTANRFQIIHAPSGMTLQGFALSAHMIGAHGFFGGPQTTFRLEPDDVVRLLGFG